MRRPIVALLIVITGCSTEVVDAPNSTTGAPTTSSTVPAATTTSTQPPPAGQLIPLDLPTLQPLSGVDPISIGNDTWSMTSPDGSLLVVFKWDENSQIEHARSIDVENWRQVASFQLGPISGIAINGNVLHTFAYQSGELLSVDLLTGQESVLADWSPHHWLYEGPIDLPGGRIAALVSEPVANDGDPSFSVFVLDLATGESTEFPVGNVERVIRDTGIFDGEWEIPERDSPGLAWGDDRLLLAYMDGPEVVEVDLKVGEIQSHPIDLSTWWDRVWAYWQPSASAKGASLGTYSSAALAPDGRYLFISGNKHTVTTNPDGAAIEESEHLGLVVVDTETWRPVGTPDLPIQHVRAIDGAILGVDTTSFQPWTSDYYLLSIDQAGHPQAKGPLTVTDGSCEQAATHRYLLCTEYSPTIRVRSVDMETLETLAERAIGSEDIILPNGVLVDFLPRSNP